MFYAECGKKCNYVVENNEKFVLNILRVFASELAAATLGLQMCNPRPSRHFRVEK
jgi:hypothetical protein